MFLVIVVETVVFPISIVYLKTTVRYVGSIDTSPPATRTSVVS